jgi:hypothetical protein
MSITVHCTCGNTDHLSNKMEAFEVHLVRFTTDSKTGVISVACKLCGCKTEPILIGN